MTLGVYDHGPSQLRITHEHKLDLRVVVIIIIIIIIIIAAVVVAAVLFFKLESQERDN